MGTNSLIEMYTTLFGWIMYNNVYDVLNGTLLTALPFLAVLTRALLSYQKASFEVPTKMLVRNVEINTGLILAAFILAVCPLMPLEMATVTSTRVNLECGAGSATVDGASGTGTSYDAVFADIGGQSARVPVVWGIVVQLSGAITAATTSSIPCSADLRGFQMQLSNQSVADPAVRQEVQEFVQQCYAPAVSSIQTRAASGDIPAQGVAMELGYMGSQLLLASPEYQRPVTQGRTGWAPDVDRDAGYGGDANGHPTCAQWWSGLAGDNDGLRSRLLGSIDPALVNQALNDDAASGGVGGFFDFANGGNDDEQTQDELIASVVRTDRGIGDPPVNNDYSWSNRAFSSTGAPEGGVFDFAVNAYQAIAGGAGLLVNTATHYPSMMLVREALPIVKAFALMAIYMFLPVVLVLSGYSWSLIGTAGVAIFAVQFLDCIWGVAFWMDNKLLGALQTSDTTLSTLLGVSTDLQMQMVMDLCTSVLYLGLPILWLTMLTWAGFRIGQGIATFTSQLTSPASSAGAQGGKLATSAAAKML